MLTILASWEQPGKVAIESSKSALLEGNDILGCLEQGLATAELDPGLLAIGLGSLPNSEGELELDASIMEGGSMRAGAVCAVKDIVPVISVARMVMDRTPHVMLAGDQARQFAIEQGFKPRNLMTPESTRRYLEWLNDPERSIQYIHASGEKLGDTVTMLGLDQTGHLAAASSTSGLPFKMPGRVGDSPIVGAGIYADDEVGAAGATGNGEELWRACASFRAVDRMREGMSPQEACEDTILYMMRRGIASKDLPCVVMALNKYGVYGAACSVKEFQLWAYQNNKLQMKRCQPLQ